MQLSLVTSRAKRNRLAVLGAALLGMGVLAGCTGNNMPQASNAPSGITASNGGGMRATGAIPDVTVTNGTAAVGTMPRNPRVPTY